jgi:hypothetical protein
MLKRRWRIPWEVVPEIWGRPPLNAKTSMADPLGGDVEDLGGPTTQRENVGGQDPKSVL